MMMSFISLGFVGVLWAVVGYSLAFSAGNNYLGDLSRVLDYVLAVTGAQPELADFDAWLRREVVPAFAAVQRRTGPVR